MKTFKEMITGNLQESSNQNFIDAVLRHLKGADEKTIRMVMNAMADGKHSKAARILGNVKPAKGDLGNIKEASALQEGMGKRHVQFVGTDEIGKFWVVVEPETNSILKDILFEADVWDMHLQLNGGQSGNAIVGLYKKKSKAKKIAEDLIEQKFRDTVNS